MTTKSLGMSFFASTYTKIKENLPHIELHFDMSGKNQIRTQLKREQIEFAIVVYDHANFSQFTKHTIKKGRFNLYQAKSSTLEFQEQELFIDEREGMYIHQLREYLVENDYPLTMKDIGGWELVAHFTNIGLGIGFFPDYIAAGNRYLNIKPYPLDLPFEYEIAAIYNKSTKLSRAAHAVIDQFSLE